MGQMVDVVVTVTAVVAVVLKCDATLKSFLKIQFI